MGQALGKSCEAGLAALIIKTLSCPPLVAITFLPCFGVNSVLNRVAAFVFRLFDRAKPSGLS